MSDQPFTLQTPMTDFSKAVQEAREDPRIATLTVNLIVCLDMLREACSPYVPSSGRDNEWLARRDRPPTRVVAVVG